MGLRRSRIDVPDSLEHGPRWPSTRHAVVWAAIVLILVAGYASVSWYTSRPAFCNSCHEMEPYYSAWQAGEHSDTSCVDCHVGPGVVANLAHKVVALKEVWVHFTGRPTFPMATVVVPKSRCLRCHDGTIDPGIKDFDHEEHRGSRECMTCHDTAGHAVTPEALTAAGILNADVQAAVAARKLTTVGSGVPLGGHVQVPCSRCHDMPAATCAACHTPTADHSQRPCTTCHESAATWAFTHPDTSATCVLCHDRPPGHPDGTCSTCHTTGASWAFVHPTSDECASCHTPPKNHYAGSCVTCHTPSTPFGQTVFMHPGQKAACTDCHSRPSSHASGQCSSCHKASTTWAFAHTSSKACADCHKAPKGHYGASCASCHSASRPWASATFAHPSIPGGEHGYRSFACSKCHPNGYGSYTCTACHDGPPDDD